MADAISAAIHIEAEPERVFSYFTDPEAMVRWMGELRAPRSDRRGEFAVDIEGVPVRGRYLEVEPPRRLLISWGHAGFERLPPGASTVEVRLCPVGAGTRVEVTHSGLPEPEASGHEHGWRHFLGRLATAVTPPGSPGPAGRERRDGSARSTCRWQAAADTSSDRPRRGLPTSSTWSSTRRRSCRRATTTRAARRERRFARRLWTAPGIVTNSLVCARAAG